MIDLEKSYGLPPHSEQAPFALGDRVKLRKFPNPLALPVFESNKGIVLETRLYGDNIAYEKKYQQIRLETGWTSAYWWELDQ